MKERIILGIDPGTNIMGYAIVHFSGNKATFQLMDVIKLSEITDHPLKLKKIFERVLQIIDTYHPDELAIEAPFYGKNPQSMLKLGRAQGVAMAAALYRNIPIFEYSPRKVKQSITGNGNASKEQVAAMLNRMLNFGEVPKFLDATDALALAVCHGFGNRESSSPDSKSSSWKNFIAKNPEKVIGKKPAK
jgi:crossover junction endodeoxyribonuclease RuvC